MLDNSSLELILKDWNFWDQAVPKTIPRQLLKSVPKLSPDLVLVIQGVRRCGKSTLLVQLIKQLKLSIQACTFVNFEDPRLSEHLNYKLLDQVVAFAKKRRPRLKKHYFFFDEIQNVQDWQKWLHVKTERPKQEHFIITGSNAALLSGDLGTRLTGRHSTLELFPFSFCEYQTAKPKNTLEDYLNAGGFPRVLSFHQSQELLREYFTDIIERDVRRHVAARSPIVLSRLVKAIFESTGSEVSQRSLAGMLGVTADTIGSYLEACELAYMILPCPYFTFSERQQTARNKKYYPIDLGLRQAVITKTGSDRGKQLETLIFHHLRKKHRQVYYWRKKGEVDFITMDSSGITPYQVSWGLPKERHLQAIEEFNEAYPEANAGVFIHRENIEEFLNNKPV